MQDHWHLVDYVLVTSMYRGFEIGSTTAGESRRRSLHRPCDIIREHMVHRGSLTVDQQSFDDIRWFGNTTLRICA
jgi:hypothetical protein